MVRATVVGEVVIDRVFTASKTDAARDETVTDIAGGSAANMVLALERAGHDVQLRARFSRDEAGQFLYETALQNGLDLSASVRAYEPATIVEVRLDKDGVPAYDFRMDGTADWHWTSSEISQELPENTDVIVVGSLAAVEEPGATVIQQWTSECQLHGILLAYDPNARPSAITSEAHADEVRAVMHRWVRLSDIVKVSDEDLAWYDPERSSEDIAKEWSTEGARLVVVTHGPRGAVAFRDGDKLCEVQGVSVDVVDTVGAGDTFMAWLLIGLFASDEKSRFSRESVYVAISHAVNAAALNCTQAGCHPPTHQELMDFEQGVN